jgi:hypothetical protein
VGWLRRLLGRKDNGPTKLDRSDDPRGGTQSEEYRHSDPRDIVEEGGTAMGGAGGAPQEGLSVDERRRRDREAD